MAMFRLLCKSCGWSSGVHYLVLDCVKDKERAHARRMRNRDAHDIAFSSKCPACGSFAVEDEYRYFPEDEIEAINRKMS